MCARESWEVEPSHEDKGKGKEREHSPLPTSHDYTILDNFRKRETYQSRHRAAYCDGEKSYDAGTGESIVYIPWIRRDIEERRISDSTVIEIHLGDTSEDECTIYELPSKVSMDDLDLDMFVDDPMRDSDWLEDAPPGFALGHGREGRLGENEMITLGEVPRRKDVTMGEW